MRSCAGPSFRGEPAMSSTTPDTAPNSKAPAAATDSEKLLVTADTPPNKAKLVGQNYATPDLIAKVTGSSKYAEDYRADGMLFTKLLLSPYPHARVLHIDATEALKMPGVFAILTADELP